MRERPPSPATTTPLPTPLSALIHSYTAGPAVSLGASRSRTSPDQMSCYFHPLAGAVQAFLQELPSANYQCPSVFPDNPEFSVEVLRFSYYGEHFSSKSERNSIFIPQDKKSPAVFVKYINEQREIRDCISTEFFDQQLMLSMRKAFMGI